MITKREMMKRRKRRGLKEEEEDRGNKQTSNDGVSIEGAEWEWKNITGRWWKRM